ncbi:efflux RND transporter periplasmic adaptor subunit [Acidovorax cavernicola]|uniref:Efflux RND transporter periplasmic adaptor subunit n=1 Tax=Acidovorax cavernicola TaxID=1675792 RepID=A0A9X8GT33_9BURK|nr:efflux RND transporter periplasmic adaptor subunit [Acidovorax cavernicola]RIX75544.1 efflux RND transporter periplasmic adaptor subunit [Acidovorax cavernicola]
MAAFAALALAAVAVAYVWASPRDPGWETAVLRRGDIESSVTAIGTLQPRRYVDVGAQVSGQILRLHVQPGDPVKKGQLMVEIDPSVQQATVDAGRASLAGLRAQLADQHAQHKLARQQFARQQQMAAEGATRAEDVQTAEATLASAAAKIAHLEAQIAQTQATLKADEARLGYTRIYAPMAGSVVSVQAREGQTLNATYQTPDILRVADLSSMTVWTEVSEADVRRVKRDMAVYFTTLGADRRRWEGTVRQVLPSPPVPAGKSGSDTPQAPAASKVVLYTVLFDVDNADGELMPQMTAQVNFVAASARDVVVAPLPALTAVKGQSGRFTARVLGPDGKPAPREVRIGVRDRLSGEVLEGLAEGERLITGERAAGGGPRKFQL